MHARIARIPNYLISLSLIALLAAVLVADQARANLHPEIRASSAFHTSTREHNSRDVSLNAGCRTDGSNVDGVVGTTNATRSAADAAVAGAPRVHRYPSILPARRARQVANEPR